MRDRVHGVDVEGVKVDGVKVDGVKVEGVMYWNANPIVSKVTFDRSCS